MVSPPPTPSSETLKIAKSLCPPWAIEKATFLPSGEKFEYGMKEKSMASVKVWKEYALEVGIKETDWDKGVNNAVYKHYGSKYSEKATNQCHSFLEATIPNGKDRVKKVAQTLY